MMAKGKSQFVNSMSSYTEIESIVAARVARTTE